MEGVAVGDEERDHPDPTQDEWVGEPQVVLVRVAHRDEGYVAGERSNQEVGAGENDPALAKAERKNAPQSRGADDRQVRVFVLALAKLNRFHRSAWVVQTLVHRCGFAGLERFLFRLWRAFCVP